MHYRPISRLYREKNHFLFRVNFSQKLSKWADYQSVLDKDAYFHSVGWRSTQNHVKT